MFVLILRILASLFNIFMLISIIGWLNEKRSRERLVSAVVLYYESCLDSQWFVRIRSRWGYRQMVRHRILIPALLVRFQLALLRH